MELDLGERQEALPPNGFARAHRIPPTSWENGLLSLSVLKVLGEDVFWFSRRKSTTTSMRCTCTEHLQ